MPKIVKPLNDTRIKNAKPTGKEQVLRDGQGLTLRIRENGSKSWSFEYQQPYTKKTRKISFGKYPEVSLSRARELRAEARELLAQGIDPKVHKEEFALEQANKHKETFKAVALDWFEVKKTTVGKKRAADIERNFKLHIFPIIGEVPVSKLTARIAIDAMKPIQAQGKIETLERACSQLNMVMDYAVNTGVIDFHTCGKIRTAFKTKVVRNYPALKPQELSELMQALTSNKLKRMTRCLIEFQLHTMVRPQEAACATWDEFDIENKLWRIPAKRMKMKNEHAIPLSKEVLKLLELIKIEGRVTPLNKGNYLFPSTASRTGHVSKETANKGIKRIGLGAKTVAHGLRALASTVLNEQEHDYDLIEKALAHSQSDVRARYNRAEYIEKRRPMMQAWSDFIVKASEANVSLAYKDSSRINK